jgi:hypothetical protein
MIISPSLPEINGLFGKFPWKSLVGQYLLMLMLGFINHRGRMSAQQAASAIVGRSRHRAGVGRFLQNHGQQLHWLRYRSAGRLLRKAPRRGRFLFVVDTTSVGHQGEKTENTFSTGNRQRRPAKGRRYSKYKHARRGCHSFVCGLLITPQGVRIPSFRCYYTHDYCREHQRAHRTQADLAAELVAELSVPDGVEVVVLGDTAFESRQMRAACDARRFYWIMPANPERVLAGPKPRPKLWSLTRQFRSSQFAPIRLRPKQGPLLAMRRTSPCRPGSRTKPRTFFVHEERRAVHSIGEIRIVFSTKQKPEPGKRLVRNETKLLLTNAQHLSVAEIVELYLLRWQIELFFKELKSSLGMHQYRFRCFQSVEAWVEACFITFLYLEWIRLQRLRSRKVARHQKQWWGRQRTYGLALAVSQRLAETQIRAIHTYTATEWGIKKLRRLLRTALPTEYRNAA